MRKCIFPFLLSFVLCLHTKGQAYDTTKIQGFLQYMMQSVDKSQVPTGYLEEYGLPAFKMTPFDGTANPANWSEPNLWRLLYFQLYSSFTGTGTNPMPTIQQVNSTIGQSLSPGAPVPIPVLLGRYSQFRPEALQQNLLSYNAATRRLYDVPGRTQSPCTTHRLFSAVPMRQASLTGTESFVFKTGMVWGNQCVG